MVTIEFNTARRDAIGRDDWLETTSFLARLKSHLIGPDQRGTIVLREKLTRGRIGARLANVRPCLIGIEAGTATHYLARELLALGHDVRQVPPAYDKPFRQGHKNDFRDAYAIAEAVRRPSTRCVPVKNDDQLDLQALHRVRSRLRVREAVESDHGPPAETELEMRNSARAVA